MKRKMTIDGDTISVLKKDIEKYAPWRLQGIGVFETMRSKSNKIIFLNEHLKRLLRGLKKLNIKSPYSKHDYKKIIKTTLRANQCPDARVRLTVWKNRNHVRTSVIVQRVKSLSLKQIRKGWKAECARIRINEKDPSVSLKSIDYNHYIKAYRNAVKYGCDESLLLNTKGYLAEGSRSNIFFIKNNVLYTPQLNCGCLNGITRQVVLKIAKKLGIKCRNGEYVLSELMEADEAFMTNAGVGVIPLLAVEKKAIGNGKYGGLTEKIYRQYREITK